MVLHWMDAHASRAGSPVADFRCVCILTGDSPGQRARNTRVHESGGGSLNTLARPSSSNRRTRSRVLVRVLDCVDRRHIMTSMSTFERETQLLTAIVAPLCGPLYEALDRAQEIADDHFASFDMYERDYRSGVAHLARAHAYRLMRAVDAAGELGEWKVLRPANNLQLRMCQGGVSLRMLRPVGDEPPPPGRNRARIAAWHGNVFGLEGSKLLGLWQRAVDDEVEVRIVRPTGAWKLGQRSRIDIDFMLPRSAGDLESYEFRPTDEDMEMVLPFEVAPGEDEFDAGDASE